MKLCMSALLASLLFASVGHADEMDASSWVGEGDCNQLLAYPSSSSYYRSNHICAVEVVFNVDGRNAYGDQFGDFRYAVTDRAQKQLFNQIGRFWAAANTGKIYFNFRSRYNPQPGIPYPFADYYSNAIVLAGGRDGIEIRRTGRQPEEPGETGLKQLTENAHRDALLFSISVKVAEGYDELREDASSFATILEDLKKAAEAGVSARGLKRRWSPISAKFEAMAEAFFDLHLELGNQDVGEAWLELEKSFDAIAALLEE